MAILFSLYFSIRSKGSYCGNSGIRFKLRHVAKLTFLPNYSGHVIIRLAPIVIDLNGQHFYGEDQDLTIVINPINDSPSLRWGVANVDVDIPYISSLPISLISESDHGILVKDITDAYFQDADNDDLGMAVISAQFSDLGRKVILFV